MKQKIRSHILFRLRKSFLQFKRQVSKHVLKQISKQVLSRFKLSKLLLAALRNVGCLLQEQRVGY